MLISYVKCDPIIWEMVLFYTVYTQRQRGTTRQDFLKWIDDAIKIINDCQDGHFGDECVLCMS